MYVYSNGEGAFLGYTEDEKPIGNSKDILIEIDKIKDIRNTYVNDGIEWVIKSSSDNKGSIEDDVRSANYASGSSGEILDNSISDAKLISTGIKKTVNDVSASLAEKAQQTDVRLKTVKLELEDASPTLVSAITGGATVNLLSIPQDLSVTPAKTNNQIPNTKNTGNLFIKANAILGKYIANTTGVETVNAAFAYVVLNVIAGAYYFVYGDFSGTSNYGSFTDSSDVYISGFVAPNFVKKADSKKYTLKIPAGATKVKINIVLTQIDNTVIFQDATKFSNGITIEDKWLNTNIARKSDTPFMSNIFKDINPLSVLDYCYLRNDNTPTASTTLFNTTPFPVKPGEIYLVENWTSTYAPSSMGSRGLYLDSNFVFISYIPIPDSYSPEYTIPSGVAYMTLLFEGLLLNTLSIKRKYVPVEDVLIRKSAIYPAINDSIVNGWSGKKWTSFGDSVTYRNLWQPYVIVALDLVHTNCGIGSTLLAGVANPSLPCFWEDSRLNAVKAANPDVVTILGGANDLANNILIGDSTEFAKTLATKNKNNFLGAYSYIIENLLTWKPTLRILLLTTTYAHMDGSDLSGITTGLSYTDFDLATKTVAHYYGLPHINLHEDAGINKMNSSIYLSDDMHPNDAGAKRYAELVIGKFKSINFL